MTTKILTGTYVSGYLLKAPISRLSITGTGYIEGSGVTTPANATGAYSVLNSGRIVEAGGSGAGIDLTNGGAVINGSASVPRTSGDYIYGADGVSIQSAPGTVANYGLIVGSGAGVGKAAVYLGAGGGITNGGGVNGMATIAGYRGVEIAGASGSVNNLGTIEGRQKTGVYLRDGGEVTNGSPSDTGALVAGGTALGAHGDGVEITGSSGTVMNFGLITAGGDNIGVDLYAGGKVVNGSVADKGALILAQAGDGVYSHGGSVQNFGTIEGGSQGSDTGVFLYGGGLVNGSNTDTTALIQGYNDAVQIFAPLNTTIAPTLSNYGTISGTAGGVALETEGLIVNGSASDTVATIKSIDGGAVQLGSFSSTDTLTVWNFGTIQTAAHVLGGDGVSGGPIAVVTNGSAEDRTALIEGYLGVAFGAGTITNFGTILGTSGSNASKTAGAVYDNGGGLVTNGAANDTAARISGAAGIVCLDVPATVVNFGTVSGDAPQTGVGVYLRGGGVLTNGAVGDGAAVISGATGIEVSQAAATIVNFGTIEGTGGTAFVSSIASDVLVVEAKSVFIGAVNGDGGTLDLASGVGTISGLAGGNVTVSGSMATTPFTNFGTIEIGSGARFTTSGAVSLAVGQKLIDIGALTLTGAIANAGEIGLVSLGVAASLVIGAAGVTLSGGGRVILSNAADNVITGASSAAALTNVDNTLRGAGRLGAGSLTLVNEAKGVIVGSLAAALTIDTGANTIVNAGIILARGAGGTMIESAVANSGILESAGGVLTVNGAVSGTGAAMIYSGTVDFTSAFSQKVVFQGTTGVLELAQSQNYTGTVFGFSKTGGTSLDLRDIGFVSSTEATFSGTASGGTLTVTDGTHTAHITLRGDYRASTFTASSDGHGGTTVIDPTAASTTAAHRFIAAAAGMAGSAGEAIHVGAIRFDYAPALVRPRVMTA